MDADLNFDRHVVIVGGTSGMGRAAALHLIDAGHRVTAVGRNPAKLAELAANRPTLQTERADATSRDELTALFERVGRFTDLVLFVTGVAGAGAFDSLDLDGLQRAIVAKTIAQLAAAQASLPWLDRRGSITFVSAASAQSALPETAGLAVVNGGLEAAVKPLAAELAPRRVNAISPGVVDTAWWDSMGERRDDVLRGFAEQLPVGRIGHVNDIVRAVDFVVLSGFVTGTVLTVDGGGHL